VPVWLAEGPLDEECGVGVTVGLWLVGTVDEPPTDWVGLTMPLALGVVTAGGGPPQDARRTVPAAASTTRLNGRRWFRTRPCFHAAVSNPSPYRCLMAFTSEILSAGMGGHAALVPPEVAAGFASKRPPVIATVNGEEYRTRLMVYGGKTYLGLRKDLLRKLGAGPGDQIEVELIEDTAERVVTEPPELLDALAANPAARAAYDALPYTHRLEYARWISEGKKDETRATRTEKTIKRLTGSS
jgi:Bacteriocin-protection, YdeI or OmpD-Associated/Domain of unknown function (DUF1905)